MDTNVIYEQEPPLILIVEDDRTTRMLLRRAMEKEGYRVIEAADGEEGIADFVRQKPDIVLLDAMMPVMDGFTCCQHFQQMSGGNTTPVLMITSLDDPDSVDRAFEVGATDYITKPIHWPVLRQRVRRLIEQNHLYQKLEFANQQLQRLALIDGLTQVANRRRFDEYLEREWFRQARERSCLSLILCDVDFFKAYNDTYGHQAGDECLRLVARAIAQEVKRSADLVARYGGEEFAVILPNTDAVGAVYVAENIRIQIEALAIPHATSTVRDRVTLSLGVTSLIPESENEPAMILSLADKALYQAKASGRNQLILIGNEE
ncbi:PleD family two-component system response regulator [Ancylothrix sp. C2]|uniref:response regulator n=1 Tax=Ancylothrix sp. D3o TaxID=2953691 RepID=UPI0021BB5418|nr:PleD family two-component system response regulator [Ancylothrix sp. D3o]MCT7948958.1 PleD family two-component system response regulator [Ancylothrix sp. D3o]